MCDALFEMTKVVFVNCFTARKPGASQIQSIHESCRLELEANDKHSLLGDVGAAHDLLKNTMPYTVRGLFCYNDMREDRRAKKIWAIDYYYNESVYKAIIKFFLIIAGAQIRSDQNFLRSIHLRPVRDMMFVATNKLKASVPLGTGCLKIVKGLIKWLIAWQSSTSRLLQTSSPYGTDIMDFAVSTNIFSR